jgi:hypothetical protein
MRLQQTTCRDFEDLLDYFVGATKQRDRKGEAERPSGFEVDRELHLRGLLNRQVGWLGAFEDAIDVWRLCAGTRRGPSFNGEAGYFHRR